MKEICNAEDIKKAQVAIKNFQARLRAKYSKAVAKITDSTDALLDFGRHPTEHRV